MQTSSVSISNRFNRITMTRHAAKRAQQRGLDPQSLQLVKAFGERSYDGQGAVRYQMTERAMRSLVRALGRTQQIDALAGAYLVLDAADETVVITASHRWN